MAKRKRAKRDRAEVETVDYTDAEGNVLTLRKSLSPGTIRKINSKRVKAAATVDDVWRRRSEMLFERLAVSWEIAGMPLSDQKMLLGRYRMASGDEQRWVRETIDRHLREHIPEVIESRS